MPIKYKDVTDYEKPNIITNKKFKVEKRISKGKHGTDIVYAPKDTMDKLDANKTVDTIKYGWTKEQLNEYMRKNFEPKKDMLYKIYLLTSTGWYSGKLFKGEKLYNYAEFSKMLDSDQNFDGDADDVIYAVHMFES